MHEPQTIDEIKARKYECFIEDHGGDEMSDGVILPPIAIGDEVEVRNQGRYVAHVYHPGVTMGAIELPAGSIVVITVDEDGVFTYEIMEKPKRIE